MCLMCQKHSKDHVSMVFKTKTWNAINCPNPAIGSPGTNIRVWVQRALPTIIYKQPLAKQMAHHRRVNSLDLCSSFTPVGQLPFFIEHVYIPKRGNLGLMVSQGSHLCKKGTIISELRRGPKVHLSPSYSAVSAAIPQLFMNGTHAH